MRFRVELVTDQDAFPAQLLGALVDNDKISVIRFDTPAWPHTTSVTILVLAYRKKNAVAKARELMLPVFRSVVHSMVGGEPFGFTLGIEAVPAS